MSVDVQTVPAEGTTADAPWRPPEAASAAGNGHTPPLELAQLKAWLTRIEADLHAAWLDCTTTASQELNESLQTALRVMDQRLARAVEAGLGTSVEAGLARSNHGLRDELSTLVATSLADLESVVSAARAEWAQGSQEQRAALQSFQQLTDGLVQAAAELKQPGRGMEELKAGLDTGLATMSQRLLDEVATGRSVVVSDVQNALAAVRGEQHELRERLARIETMIGNLASNLGAQLQRGRQAAEQQLAAVTTSTVNEATKRLSQEVASARKAMAAQVESALEKVTKGIGQDITQARAASAAELRAALAEATKCISEELATSNTMLLADVEARLADAVEQQTHARQAQQVQLDGGLRQIAERLASELAGVKNAMDHQRRAFEDALMTLVKAVSDERRTSAALMKNALAATDETVRNLTIKVDRLAAGVEWRAPRARPAP